MGVGREREIVLGFSREFHAEGDIGLGPLQVVGFFGDKEWHHRQKEKQEQRHKGRKS